jgi:BED zinc finger
MGWAYGKMINGNRQHWQCNWCGLTRFGGGVTRLKRHLAGDLHVRQCPNAPADVVKEVRRNLILSDSKLKKKNKEVVVEPLSKECPDRVKMGKERIEAESTKVSILFVQKPNSFGKCFFLHIFFSSYIHVSDFALRRNILWGPG